MLNVHSFEQDSSKDLIPEADRPQAAMQSFVSNVDAEMQSKTSAFIEQAARVKRVNFHFFSLLEKWPTGAPAAPASSSLVFHPPKEDSNLDRSSPQHSVAIGKAQL